MQEVHPLQAIEWGGSCPLWVLVSSDIALGHPGQLGHGQCIGIACGFPPSSCVISYRSRPALGTTDHGGSVGRDLCPVLTFVSWTQAGVESTLPECALTGTWEGHFKLCTGGWLMLLYLRFSSPLLVASASHAMLMLSPLSCRWWSLRYRRDKLLVWGHCVRDSLGTELRGCHLQDCVLFYIQHCLLKLMTGIQQDVLLQHICFYRPQPFSSLPSENTVLVTWKKTLFCCLSIAGTPGRTRGTLFCCCFVLHCGDMWLTILNDE